MRVHRYENPEVAGVPFGQSVLDLATDAKRVIQGSADRAEAEALLQRIDLLRGECGETPSAPIYHWLVSLRREVERV